MKKIEVIVEAFEAVNLSKIEIYDMKEKSPFYDYLIISSATSDRQLQAAISHIQKDLAENNFDHPRVEGTARKYHGCNHCASIHGCVCIEDSVQ